MDPLLPTSGPWSAPVIASVVTELERILEGHVALAADGALPRQAFDPEWISPCQVGEPDADGTIAWRPRRRIERADWSGLERALDTELHPDLADFYGTYWSDCIPVSASEGTATLIQIWNQRDFDRLLENLIGHALQKTRRREPLTLFVASADESEYTLSVENETAIVVLEQPGQAPSREVASSLGELLARLEPVAD